MHNIIINIFIKYGFAENIIKFLNEEVDSFSTLHWIIRNFVHISGSEKSEFPFSIFKYLNPDTFIIADKTNIKKYFIIKPIIENDQDGIKIAEFLLEYFKIPYVKSTIDWRECELKWCRRAEGYKKAKEEAAYHVHDNKGILIMQEDYKMWGLLHFNIQYKDKIEAELNRLHFKYDIVMP